MDEGEESDRRRVAIQTIGCKLNQAESECLARRFLEAGYQLVPPDASPDIYVLNTCTVTHIADRKCRHLLRQTYRQNPNAFIVVTGCYAQRVPQELGQIEGVALVLSNEDKNRLLQPFKARLNESITATKQTLPSPFRTRTSVKIQDGCNESCSYCIVPQTRGRERDVPIDQVLTEVKERVNEGYKEVTLTGTQIGNYGGNGGLKELVNRILSQTEVQRLRLSSLRPQDLSPSLPRIWDDNRICRHLHIPLQSGSDTVLQWMRRCYSTTEYERAVTMAQGLIPGVAITTDIMVGFPGESEDEFEQSLRFCERMGFARLHVFPFSERPGTAAARMPNKVDVKTKRERSQIMLQLGQRMAQVFSRRFLGQRLTVLWEEEKHGIWSGHTDNYIKVFTKSDKPLDNKLLSVRLVAEYEQGLWGEL
jgi:threonylcarbamoyladenosine tRNA methylthiotransferase MtaB